MKKEKKRFHRYTAFVEANKHGGYTVTVPAPGFLVTEGKDLDNARSIAKDAVLHRRVKESKRAYTR